jgi:hypothetical protein
MLRFLGTGVFMEFSEIRFLINVDKGMKSEGELDLEGIKTHSAKSISFPEHGRTNACPQIRVRAVLCSNIF